MTHLNSFLLVATLLMLTIIGGCTKDEGPLVIRPEVDTISFKDTILPMLVEKCVMCHPGNASLDLGQTNAYSDMVGVTSLNYSPVLRVSSGEPEGSVLYQKVVGKGDVGAIMPLGSDPLTEGEVGLIYDWISQGAMDN